ncbi:MAG: hypothetical protein R3B70_10600 [Polyangiaceae bacterium]
MSSGGPAHLAPSGAQALSAAGAPTGEQSLIEIGKSSLFALMGMVPRAMWRGLKGAFGGFFLVGILGLVLAGAGAAASAAGLVAQPRWLLIVNLLWVPFVLGVAGGYVGAINGFLSTVAEEVESRGLAARIFAVVKPVCLAVARKARGAPTGDLTADLRAALDQRLSSEDTAAPRGLGDRAEAFLASRSRKILCLSVLRTVVTAKDRGAAIANLESLGVRQLGAILSDSIEDLFSMQVYLAAALALVLAAAPAIVWSLAGSVL